MFSQTVEYALRAVVDLASRDGQPVPIAAVAERTLVPKPYLAKILQTLTRAGIVTARRGTCGGVSLTRPADQVTLLEVVNAVEPVGRIAICPLGLPAHGHRLCPLHKRLDDALAAVEAAFAATTLVELVGTPSAAGPLCDAGNGTHRRVPLPVKPR
jgi:Rrf2 family nitric oxide-sensitive transcriptional repressor